jgi:hypothetical protein
MLAYESVGVGRETLRTLKWTTLESKVLVGAVYKEGMDG